MKTDVIIVGGFHEIIELCEDCGLNVVGIIDNVLRDSYYGVPIIGRDEDAERLFPQYGGCKVIITPDSPKVREKLVNQYKAIGYEFATLISPLAHISKSAEIGEGTIIQAGVNVSSATKIGCFCKLNSYCNVMHDNVIGDYTTIAPNAVLLGRVTTGKGAYVGANSTLLPIIKIGAGSTVGAGAVVTRSVDDSVIVKGVPAKIKRNQSSIKRKERIMMFSERIQSLIIDSGNTIIQTMKMMDDARTKSLLVFEGDIFVGMITNGDLQRAIIANKPFNTPISTLIDNTNKTYAHQGDDIQQIKDWMKEVRAEYMPVLDAEGNLADVILWEDVLSDTKAEDNRPKIDLPVVIMAGGKGTRLKPITNVIPKPLVPVGDKTILEVILDQFEGIGCHKFYMSVNYKADMMKYYLSQLPHQYNIEFFQEDKPLGTIGSVSLLKGKITTPFFVSNCDSINEQDYRDVYDYHVENHNDLTIVTMVKTFKIPYGVIETGEDGLMVSLSEKPELTYQVNTGVYILNPSCIEEIPEGEFFHITHLMEKITARGGRVGCFPVSEHAWKDMGEWPEYLKMIKVL